MKIKEGYLLKQVAGKHVVVPVGDLNFDGLISLNETGAFLWRILEEGCDELALVRSLSMEYGISEEQAKTDISAFLTILRNENLIHE